jgi:hypothetical protein
MPLKIVPFSQDAEGRWVGKVGRYAVTISRQVGNSYWRGPDKDLVLRTERETYSFSVRGSHSGMAYTLAGAMAESERECRALHGSHVQAGPARYAMTQAEAALEETARDLAMADAVEADRIAHARGWELAMDVLPDLKAFAERKGLYPFEGHAPGPGL